MATTKTLSPAAAIAAAARAAIKTARTNGKVTLPDGAKISVRSSSFAGGYSVGIDVKDINQEKAFTVEPGPYGDQLVPIPAVAKLGRALTAILARASDGYCWGDVTIAGIAVDGGTIAPRSWRMGQD